MTHSFAKGDRVAIINSTMAGKFFIEGTATIRKPVPDADEQYVVDFGDGIVERFVDPAAQADPKAFVERLNKQFFATA